MKKIFLRSLPALALFVAFAPAGAQQEGLVGDWDFVTTGFSFVGSTTSYANVTIEEQDGELRAYIYNGPAPLRVNGDEFELDIDWRSGFDVEYLSTFRGRIGDDGTLAGELTHHGATNFLGRAWRDGQFTATRAEPMPDLDGLAPQPVDMTGVYNRASGYWGINKIAFSMTDRG